MAAAYRTHGEPYRESIRSVQSNSVYSTDSGSSPLDSIIRDYPLVPGASPSAFQFSPNSYNSSPRMPASLANKYQQQPSTQARLREPQYPPGENTRTRFLFITSDIFVYLKCLPFPLVIPCCYPMPLIWFRILKPMRTLARPPSCTPGSVLQRIQCLSTLSGRTALRRIYSRRILWIYARAGLMSI